MDSKINNIDDTTSYLVENSIMKHDLNNLLNIVALRRGLIISSQTILHHITESQYVNITAFAKL